MRNIVQSKTHQPLAVGYVLYACPKCNVPQVSVTVKASCRKLPSGFASMIDKYCEKAGFEKIPLRAFHRLWCSFKTVRVSHGALVETVSRMIGHKTMLRTYLEIFFSKVFLSVKQGKRQPGKNNLE